MNGKTEPTDFMGEMHVIDAAKTHTDTYSACCSTFGWSEPSAGKCISILNAFRYVRIVQHTF